MLTKTRYYHKILCKSFADFVVRPNAEVRCAILLPEKSDKPVFMWLPVQSGENSKKKFVHSAGNGGKVDDDFGVPEHEDSDRYVLPTKGNIVGGFGSGGHSLILVCGKLRSGELLDHAIQMLARKNKTGCVPNKCVVRFGGEEFARPYKGPLILFGTTKFKFSKTAVDLDTVDLTLALDSLIAGAAPGVKSHIAQKMTGVKVIATAPFFEELQVPKRHPVFTRGTMSKISELLGGQLAVWMYPMGVGAQSSDPASEETHDTPNRNATVLLTCLDPESADFGRVPASFQADQRAMLVVHQAYDLDPTLDVSTLTAFVDLYAEMLPVWLAHLQGMSAEEKTGEIFRMAGKFNELMRETYAARFGKEALDKLLEETRREGGM